MGAMLRKTGIFGLTLVLGMTTVCPATDEDLFRLTLSDAVNMALTRNPEARVAYLDTLIQIQRVSRERAKFQKKYQFDSFYTSDRLPSTSGLEEVNQLTNNNQEFDFELSQQLDSGGIVSLEFYNSRSSSNAGYRLINPVYETRLGMRFTQPMLRGRGRIIRVNEYIESNNLEKSKQMLKGKIADLVVDIHSTYWDLFYERENLKVYQRNSEGARRVLQTAQAKVEAGAAAKSDVLEAEVSMALREEDIVLAKDKIQDQEGHLKYLLGLEVQRHIWDMRIVTVDAPPFIPFEGDLEEGLKKGVEVDEQYQEVLIELKNLDLQIESVRNNMQPRVDLVGQANLNGIDRNYMEAVGMLGKGDGFSLQVGLSLDLPIGNTMEVEKYRTRLLERKQKEVALEKFESQIKWKVHEAFRQVQTDYKRIEVAKQAESLANQRVSEEEHRMSLGLSTVRRVLDAQDEMTQAQSDFLKALVDYNKSLMRWKKITGEI